MIFVTTSNEKTKTDKYLYLNFIKKLRLML